MIEAFSFIRPLHFAELDVGHDEDQRLSLPENPMLFFEQIAALHEEVRAVLLALKNLRDRFSSLSGSHEKSLRFIEKDFHIFWGNFAHFYRSSRSIVFSQIPFTPLPNPKGVEMPHELTEGNISTLPENTDELLNIVEGLFRRPQGELQRRFFELERSQVLSQQFQQASFLHVRKFLLRLVCLLSENQIAVNRDQAALLLKRIMHVEPSISDVGRFLTHLATNAAKIGIDVGKYSWKGIPTSDAFFFAKLSEKFPLDQVKSGLVEIESLRSQTTRSLRYSSLPTAEDAFVEREIDSIAERVRRLSEQVEALSPPPEFDEKSHQIPQKLDDIFDTSLEIDSALHSIQKAVWHGRLPNDVREKLSPITKNIDAIPAAYRFQLPDSELSKLMQAPPGFFTLLFERKFAGGVNRFFDDSAEADEVISGTHHVTYRMMYTSALKLLLRAADHHLLVPIVDALCYEFRQDSGPRDGTLGLKINYIDEIVEQLQSIGIERRKVLTSSRYYSFLFTVDPSQIESSVSISPYHPAAQGNAALADRKFYIMDDVGNGLVCIKPSEGGRELLIRRSSLIVEAS